MKGLLIRKAFYDGWDAILFLLIANIFLWAVGFGGFALVHLFSSQFCLSVFILVLTVLSLGVVLLALSDELALITSYAPLSFKRFFSSLKKHVIQGPLFILMIIFFLGAFPLAVHWYFSLGRVFGMIIGICMLWFTLVFLLSLQWFLPVKSQLEKNFFKAVKKSFIIFFDNPGLSLFMLVYSLALLVISLVPFLLMPGISGILLAQNEAFRFLMKKYDWMEDNPEISFKTARKEVPWDDILDDDYDVIDSRSLKNLFFPWRD